MVAGISYGLQMAGRYVTGYADDREILGHMGEEQRARDQKSEGRRQKGRRQKIFHFPFSIFHFSFVGEVTRVCGHWKMTNDKWQMENGKSSAFCPSAFCLLPSAF